MDYISSIDNVHGANNLDDRKSNTSLSITEQSNNGNISSSSFQNESSTASITTSTNCFLNSSSHLNDNDSPNQVSSNLGTPGITLRPNTYKYETTETSFMQTNVDRTPKLDNNNNNLGFVNVIKPRCTPAREAVDPAKYFILTDESDGTKYACSKCGNVYKWRKSLNKHWKEKHDGEVPPSLADREKMMKFPPQTLQKHSSIQIAPISTSKNSAPISQFMLTEFKNNQIKIPINYASLFNSIAQINSNIVNVAVANRHQTTNILPWNLQAKNDSSNLNTSYQSNEPPYKYVVPTLAHHSSTTHWDNNGVLDLSMQTLTFSSNIQEHPLDFSNKTTSYDVDENPSDLRISSNVQKSNIYMVQCKQCFQTCNDMSELNKHFMSQHVNALYEAADELITDFEIEQNSTQFHKFLSKGKNNLQCVICGLYESWQWKLSKHFETDHAGIEPNPYKASMNSNNSCQYLKPNLISPDISIDSMINHIKNYENNFTTINHPHLPDENLMQKFGIIGNNVFDIDNQGTAIVIPKAPEESDCVDDMQSDVNKMSNPIYLKSNKGKKENGSNELFLPYECKLCGYKARWPSEMTQHMKNHSDEKPYQCPQCSYRSKWKWDVVKHLKRCGSNKDNSENNTHKRKKTNSKSFSEAVKDKILPETKSYAWKLAGFCEPPISTHYREVLSNGPPNVTLFTNERPLKQSSENSFGSHSESVSNMCDTAFAVSTISLVSDPSHQQHVNIHPCEQCQFVGHSPAELKRHSRVHSDEKPYSCKSCGYSSKWKCDLKKHIRTYNHTPVVPLTNIKNVDGFRNQSPEPRDICKTNNNFRNFDADLLIDGRIKCKLCEFETVSITIFTKHQFKHCHIKKETVDFKILDYNVNIEKENFFNYFGLKMCKNNDYSNHNAKTVKSLAVTNTNPFSTYYGTDIDTSNLSNFRRQIKIYKNPTKMTPAESEKLTGLSKRKRKLRCCTKCGYVTDNLTTLQRHSSKHGNGGRYACNQCDYSVDRQHVLENHMATAHLNHCQIKNIDNVFHERSKIDASIHKQENRPNNILDGKNISVSPKLFKLQLITMNNFKMKLINKNGKKYFGCIKCPFVSKYNMKTAYHSKLHGSMHKFRCPFCDFTCNQKAFVEKHVNTTHSENSYFKRIDQSSLSDKKYKDKVKNDSCIICGYSSYNFVNMIKHRLKKSCFYSHIRSYVFKNGRIYYRCSKCLFTADDKNIFLEHKKNHRQFYVDS